MESHGLEDMRLRPLTTPKRYGAGMAHTVVSIGFIDYRAQHEGLPWITDADALAWIVMDYGLSWTVMDYHGLLMIVMDYGLLWIIMD